ncbi:hypothetical protein ACLB2K_020598 [Fragaria x ananassa]
MQVVSKHDKYMGIPTLVGQSRNDTFAYIKDNLSKKLTGWRSKLDEDLRMFRSPDLNKVSDLFLSSGVWNVNLLQELFPRHIVSKILALPISSRGHHDRWIWSEDKKGKLTVKSAYHLARKRVLDHEVTQNPSSLLWNKIWKAPVPWKAASNILPTRSRLSERGVDIDTQCPFCEEEVESSIHALRDCNHAVECFTLAQIPPLPSTTVYDWLVLSVSIFPALFPTILMLLWAI